MVPIGLRFKLRTRLIFKKNIFKVKWKHVRYSFFACEKPVCDMNEWLECIYSIKNLKNKLIFSKRKEGTDLALS